MIKLLDLFVGHVGMANPKEEAIDQQVVSTLADEPFACLHEVGLPMKVTVPSPQSVLTHVLRPALSRRTVKFLVSPASVMMGLSMCTGPQLDSTSSVSSVSVTAVPPGRGSGLRTVMETV